MKFKYLRVVIMGWKFIIILIMGNKIITSQDYYDKFKQKYDFMMMMDDANFGSIKIYRKNQLNFDYVMILQKYISPNRIQTLTEEISKIHEAFLKPQEPMALRIFNFHVIKDSWSQCKIPLVRLFVEYFNFTLHDLIRRNQETEGSFSYDEIVYIMDSVIVTYKYFKEMGQTHLMVNSNAIYLSTEGCIKFSPIKSEDFYQEDNALCKALIYETKHRDLINFERGQKYIVNQMKRLASELIEMCYKGVDGRNSLELLKQIKKSNTLQKIKKLIPKPKIDCLNLNKNYKIEESLETNPTVKTQKSISPTEEVTKLSLKRPNVKQV